MNRIIIKDNPQNEDNQKAYPLSFQQANKMLPLLRSDYFSHIHISSASELNPRDMKFIIQLTRLLKTDGEVVLQTPNNQAIAKVLKSLKLFSGQINNNSQIFTKTEQIVKKEVKEQKLSIGFYAQEEQQKIDENELLQGQNLQIGKKVIEKCETKPRACANCNCGRKETEPTSVVSKQELIESVNIGKPVSGCGKCYLGDSFRCSTCPYNGLPAFKPGDKLKLVQSGSVVVEETAVYVNRSGKIKLQI